jgi:hypothetical protein
MGVSIADRHYASQSAFDSLEILKQVQDDKGWVRMVKDNKR